MGLLISNVFETTKKCNKNLNTCRKQDQKAYLAEKEKWKKNHKAQKNPKR